MSMFSIEDLEKELEDRKAAETNSRRTPVWRAGIWFLLAIGLCVGVWVRRADLRNYYFPAPVVVTTNDLSLEDVANEEQITADLETKYTWLWIMEVHRMSDGTVSILSGIHPDSQDGINAMDPALWQTISLQATIDTINAFAPAARNGVVYMRYVQTRTGTMIGVLLCDTQGTDDPNKWQCQGSSLQPPVYIEPDWIEYEDRVTLPLQ